MSNEELRIKELEEEVAKLKESVRFLTIDRDVCSKSWTYYQAQYFKKSEQYQNLVEKLNIIKSLII